jgi:hypothetical protein
MDAFLHDHLQEVSMVTVSEAYRAMVILAKGDDPFDSFEQRRRYLEDNGYARPQWNLQRDACIDRGTTAYMVCEIMGLPSGVNRALSKGVGLGDRRYSLRELHYRELIRPAPDYQFITGGELVDLLANADTYMADHGKYDAPPPVDIVEELRQLQRTSQTMNRSVIAEPVVMLADTSATAPAMQPLDKPSASTARVLRATAGRVSYSTTAADGTPGPWQDAKAGDLLPPGTRIRTRTRAHLLLQFGDDTIIAIERATLASIDQFLRGDVEEQIQLGLGHGAVRGGVAETTLRSNLTIETPTATLSKKGTIDFRISYEPSFHQFKISLAEEGLVEALNKISMESRRVYPGQYVTQEMVRWVDTATFDRFVPVVNLIGQTSLEKLFNALNDSGLAVVDPGGGAEIWAIIPRQFQEEAAGVLGRLSLLAVDRPERDIDLSGFFNPPAGGTGGIGAARSLRR